jgi:hypothetical protein
MFSVIAVFSITGHYYIHNYLEYENPFYPIQFKVLGFGFNGPEDDDGTSILSHINQPHLWKILFPTTNVSSGGILFPIIIMFGIIGLIGILSFSFSKFLKTKILERRIMFLTFFVLFNWIFYLASPLSAGATPHDFVRINDLNSMRYVIGTILLTEVLFTYILYRLRIPSPVIFLIVGLNLISRLWIISLKSVYQQNHTIFLIGVTILVGSYFFIKYRERITTKFIVMAVFVFFIFFLSPQMIEMNRTTWVPEYHNVALNTYSLPPSEIFLVSASNPNDFSKIWPLTYPVYGDRFQHSIKIGTQESLVDDISSKLNSGNKPVDYVSLLCSKAANCESEFHQLYSVLSKSNYQVISSDSHAILLRSEN